MKAYIDEDWPRDEHLDDCNIWVTDFKPCNCDALLGGLTTADRLNLIVPCPEPWLEQA